MQKHHLFQAHGIQNKASGTKEKRWRNATGRKDRPSRFLKQSIAGIVAACIFLPEELLLRNSKLPALYQSVRERSNW